MEGLIPFLMHAIKKKQPGNVYRYLSDGSTGRSYHQLLLDSGSSHRRTRSEFQPPTPTANFLMGSDELGNGKRFPDSSAAGLRHRGYTFAAADSKVSGTGRIS